MLSRWVSYGQMRRLVSFNLHLLLPAPDASGGHPDSQNLKHIPRPRGLVRLAKFCSKRGKLRLFRMLGGVNSTFVP
jgi:hypothetical protein